MKKQYAVIGLGRFGISIAQTLAEQGEEVLVVDNNEDTVNHAAAFVTHAVQMNAEDEAALRSLGLNNFDVVCVCMHDMQTSIIVTLLLKEIGVPHIVAKAGSEIHYKVLKKLGADRVVFPERDSGIHMAYSLMSSNILEFIELSPEYGIAEFEVTGAWIGKTIQQIDFRKRYGVSLIAVRQNDSGININPQAMDILGSGDSIVVLGSEEQIGELEKTTNKR